MKHNFPKYATPHTRDVAHIRQYRRAHRFTGWLVLAGVALGMGLLVLVMGGQG